MLFSYGRNAVRGMSAKAQAILDEIRALPPADLQAVCSEIRQLETRRQGWEEQKAKLREMQARYADRGLLNRLLDERAKERAGLVFQRSAR